MSVCLWTGDDTGLLKRVEVALNGPVSTASAKIQPYGVQQLGHGIDYATPTPLGVLTATHTGAVKILRNGTLHNIVDAPKIYVNIPGTKKKRPQQNILDETLVALQNVQQQHWITAFQSGTVQQFKLQNEEDNVSVVEHSLNSFKIDLQTNQTLSAVKTFGESCFAYGGKDINLTLWDLEASQVKHKFKNVPNDKLDLQVPIWISCIEHLGDGEKFATGTGYHQVRLYDVKGSKRPTLSVDVGEHKINQIRRSPCGNYLVVANALGKVQKLDLRVNLKTAGVFSGNKGSVRDLDFSDDGNCIVTVGLDRFLRVYNFSSRSKIGDIYLKQKLNCVRFGSMEASSSTNEATANTIGQNETTSQISNESDDEDGTIWDLLEEVEASVKNAKKRKVVNHKEALKA